MRIKSKIVFFLLALWCFGALPTAGTAGSFLEFWDQKCARPENRETVRCLNHRAVSLVFRHHDDLEKIKQAIGLYKKALAQDPWNFSAASGLVTAYLEIKDYPSALKTVNCTIYRRPWSLEPRLLRCQLLEGMGLPFAEAKRCFRKVAELYRESGRSDANYVLAALLAESPEAEAIKREFHKRAKPGTPDGYVWETVFKDFDRDDYLKNSKLVKEGYKQTPLPMDITPSDCMGIIPGADPGRPMSPSDRAMAERNEAEYHQKIRRQQIVAQAQAYLVQKDYGAALEIIEAESAAEPRADYMYLLRCLLREKTGRPQREYQACYRGYLAALERDDFHVADPNYVRIGILAYWPDKKSIREKVIVNFMPGTQAQKNWDQYLDILRREDVFHKMLKW